MRYDSRGLERSALRTIHTQALLFDMDGVLISSAGADERCWLQWARLHGMEADFDTRVTHGRRSIDTIHMLRPDLDAVEQVRILEEFDAEDSDGLCVLPGVLPLLASLPPERWAVVTSASERLMRQRLGAAGVPIPANIVTADHVRNGKPHPEPYATGARLLGVEPAACVVIEDAPAGVASARAAGCRVLAVLTSHLREDLVGADWIVPSPACVRAGIADSGAIELRLTQA